MSGANDDSQDRVGYTSIHSTISLSFFPPYLVFFPVLTSYHITDDVLISVVSRQYWIIYRFTLNTFFESSEADRVSR